MAHAATLDKLTDALVTALTGLTAKDTVFKALKGQAVKGLRDKSDPRTNQFAVKARLDGLTEKLAVLNRDDLADALQLRLEELPSSSKWAPEVLSLFLDLSDRPASRTVLSHVDAQDAAEDVGRQLSWEEIIADDPLGEPGVWDDIDRGYHSSADEQSDLEHDSELTVSTTATSVDGDPSSAARLHLTQPNECTIAAFSEAQQHWKEDKESLGSSVISELTLIREVLLMLHGLPTELFPPDSTTGRASISSKVMLATASSSSVSDIVTGSVRVASALNFLRSWIRSSQNLLYLRAVQAAIQRLLSRFVSRLATIEQRFVGPRTDTVVSVLDAIAEVHTSAAPLVQLSSIVQVAKLSTGKGQQLVMLDILYNEACLAQMSGATASFDATAEVFVAGLRAYLRPIATWIISGEVSALDHDVPLVEAVNTDCAPGQIWGEQFVKSTKADGSALVAKCIVAHADRLFAIGKSRAFLNRIQSNLHNAAASLHGDAGLPHFDAMLRNLAERPLLSLSQLLDDELHAWIGKVGDDCTPLLLTNLWNDHGLSATMAALPKVFFSADGIAFQDFADAVAKRVVVKRNSVLAWNDQFMLAEIARGTIGTCKGVDADCIQVNTSSGEVGSITTSTTRALDTFSLDYNFAWPLQNITGCVSSKTHAKVFAFLLQVHYADTLLTKSFFDLRSARERWTPAVPLRQKLLWFSHILHFYIATTAESIHREALKLIESACDIDAMISIWREYDRRLQMSLLLSPKLEPVRDAITGILELSEMLARTTQLSSIAALQVQFDKSLTFLVAGVRGLSRAGGEAGLEILAERLEWSIH